MITCNTQDEVEAAIVAGEKVIRLHPGRAILTRPLALPENTSVQQSETTILVIGGPAPPEAE